MKKILRLIASVDPATGGPVAGLTAVTPLLASLGWSTEFASLDAADAPFLRHAPGPVHAFGPTRGGYGRTTRLRAWLQENVRNYDAIFVHGLWQYLGAVARSTCRAVGRPYFVMPHGMLDPSLRSAYPEKHFKKWIYWQFVERRVLRDARAVFFTCEEERRLAKQTFPRYQARERVLAYGTAGPSGDRSQWIKAWQAHCAALRDQSYFLFLSRIHSKKGVDLLLRAYGQLARERASAGLSPLPALVVAGPSHRESYLASLRQLADTEGIGQNVHWVGMLSGDAKWGALCGAEVFVLPSHQENFGIAVVEAMACGTPVLISDRVNIWREIVDAQAGLVEHDDVPGTTRLLRRWLESGPEMRQTMSSAAQALFEKRFEITRAAQSVAEQLQDLLN